MFNPEKLLGGLIRSSMRGSSAGSLLKGSAALGLLGVAIEAAEHYLGNQQQSNPPNRPAGDPPPPPPPPARSMPPPPSEASQGPPPPPSARPQGPPPDAPESDTETEKAVLLIRAMIAAANADGVIDQREGHRILKRLKSVDLSPEEKTFITREFQTPATLDAIVGQVEDRQSAMQVYAVSLLAITVDTDAEQRYMQQLAQKLNLDTQTIQSIAKKIGASPLAASPPEKGE